MDTNDVVITVAKPDHADLRVETVVQLPSAPPTSGLSIETSRTGDEKSMLPTSFASPVSMDKVAIVPPVYAAPLPAMAPPTAEELALRALREQSDYDTDDDYQTRELKAARRAEREEAEQMRLDADEERRQHELAHATHTEVGGARERCS